MLLERVLYWTGGHPYLTQRMCRAVADDGSVTDAAGVDQLCTELFLAPRAREQDDNLLFVRERLRKSEVDLASLLDLYRKVRQGKQIPDDETNPLVSRLRLSGITRSMDGCLRVRNRIYGRVFDAGWIVANMPDAELRRQRAAYRRGLARATAMAAVVVAAIGGLALTAVNQTRDALRQRHRADQQRRLAQEGQQTLRRHLYGAQMNIAQQAWEAGSVAGALEVLDRWRPAPGQEDLRGFEWRYLWRLAQGDAGAVLAGHSDWVRDVAFSPDGRLLASVSDDRTVRLWDVAGQRAVGVLTGHRDWIGALAFSKDGRTLVTGGGDRTLKLWDVAARREVATLRGHTSAINAVAFSPDGKTIASGGGLNDRTVRLWEVATRREFARWYRYAPFCIALSPDERTLAVGSDDSTLRLWDIATRREVRLLRGHRGPIGGVAYSPDGRTLATASADRTIRLWSAATVGASLPLRGHTGWVRSVIFSPDGKLLASGGNDGSVRFWDLSTGRTRFTLQAHRDDLRSLAFSPDAKLLATIGRDGTLTLWDVGTRRQRLAIPDAVHDRWVNAVRFSPDGRLVAAGRADNSIGFWEVASGRQVAAWKGHTALCLALAFSPRASRFGRVRRLLASGGEENEVKLWDATALHGARAPVANGNRPLASLPGHTGSIMSLAFSPDGTLLASAGADTTVRLWRAPTFPETDPLQIERSLGGDRTVTLQWRPLPWATGYNVYRRLTRPNQEARAPGSDRWVKLNAARAQEPGFTDRGADLVNGRARTYAIAPVYRGADSKPAEGARVLLQATPAAVPPGWVGCSLNEGLHSGSAAFDRATEEITLRGSGEQIWGDTDGGYFLSQPVAGEFQITVRQLTLPTEANLWSRAGLMLRESLDPGARNLYLFTTATRGLIYQWRPAPNDATDSRGVIQNPPPRTTTLKLPMLLRLTRRGSAVTLEYSQDDGKSFRPADDPYRFQPPLAETVYVGLAISSHDPSKITEAKFRDLEIRRR